ncbi:MAG: amidohydrolase family protein [Candidatus Cyclobacteriaceae bacterium M2_1C_046]
MLAKKIFFLFSLILCSGSFLKAQDNLLVFKGATIYTISGDVIENGVLIVKDGKVTNVGSADDIRIPGDAEVQDVTGKVIMPGLVDSHSHIGGGDGGDRSSPLHPDVRILDAIDARSDSFRKARAGGITSVNIMPGSGHLMSGQTVYLKLREGETINDLLFVNDPTKEIAGGIKMANGTNPLGATPFPGTRAKSAAMVRDLFVKAQDYKAKIDAAKGDPEKMPKRDINMEALVEVLEGKRVVHNHTHRHDDILTAIRLKEEFGYRLVLHHVSEAWKVADEIAKADVAASIIILDAPGGKLEAVEIQQNNGVMLEKAGVDVGFHTDDGITDSRLFLRSAAFGVRAGMSREKALEAVTLANARMMDVQDRVGSLEKGKDADFIILSGDPLSVYTHVEQTWVEGEKVFDRSDPEDREFAIGGYEVFRGEYYDHHH